MRTALAGALLFFGGFVPAMAQFTTPIVDGIIGTNEYGVHSNGANQQPNGSTTWYMTWDADNLYIGVNGASADDGTIVYLDANPVAPINGGTNINGSIVGQAYDSTNFAPLPFRADYVFYFKDGYREQRTAVGGAWPVLTASIGTYAGTTNIREFAVPWTSIGGRPASFAWFGYATTSAGSVYGEMPAENASGLIGTGARYERYYTVSNTNSGSATWPFSRNCFVFNRASDWIDAGYMNVFDFTMNAPGRTIVRIATNDPWIMSGNLHIEAGTVSFESSYGNTIVDCDVIIGQDGRLSMSTNAGDLTVRRHLVRYGTFVPNGRRVIFSGNRIQNVTGRMTFDDLMIFKTGGAITASEDSRVNGILTLVGGNFQLTNGVSMTIAATGNITGAHEGSYIATLGSGYLKREGVGNATIHFPVGTEFSYNPVTITNTGIVDEFWASVKAVFEVPPSDPQRMVNREWTVMEATPGGSNARLAFQWNTADQGPQFVPANPVYVYRRNGSPWTGTAASVTGSGPYVATANGFSEFNKFAIGNAGATSVEDNGSAPTGFALLQNYPNPFNPSTQIRFSVENTSVAKLDVFNSLGQHVATLFDGIAEAGKYQSVRFDADGLSSGTYFYKLQSGGRVSMRKLMLVK